MAIIVASIDITMVATIASIEEFITVLVEN